MLNKQNIWFMTLFSLILVLGVYYVTMPNDVLKNIDIKAEENIATNVESIEDMSSLTALRVSKEESVKEKMESLEASLISDNLTAEEKNNTFELLKQLTKVQGKEESLEKTLKEELNLDCFVKIETININAVCVSNEHDKSLANNVMRTIQKKFPDKMNITVKFQNK